MREDIRPILREILLEAGLEFTLGELTYTSVGGGSINRSFLLHTKSNNRWFSKFNDVQLFPDLFIKEAKGLRLIRGESSQAPPTTPAGHIRTPEIIACGSAHGTQILILEWIDPGPRTAAFWRTFGEQLARMHLAPQPSASQPSDPIPPFFGLPENNYMGSLPQDNTPSTNWTDFFQYRRLEPQFQMALAAGLLPAGTQKNFASLYRKLPEIFNQEPPSLLHGDLWSGNFLCDANSQPVLIDPAVYYGHRSIDLAMTTLFGSFERPFYEAYNWFYPFPVNYTEQWEIANLYPLLIHLNLFGKSYAGSILDTIRRF